MIISHPVIYLAVTAHGFGHAVRSATVATAIKRIAPQIKIIFGTNAPQWLIQSYLGNEFIYHQCSLDVGVIQSDSMGMDKSATLEAWKQLQNQHQAVIEAEAAWLRSQGVQLILADIPPLAAPLAEAAGVSCWMMGNFGWDFIYRRWSKEFQPIVQWIESGYQKCDRLFRLPLSEPMSVFPKVVDVGLTGGDPRHSIAQLRTQFGITAPPEQTVLLTFGGLGLQKIPYSSLAKFKDWQFITFDGLAPNLPNLTKITDKNLRPVDFMPLCSRVISKPGYSTFAEAMRLEVPIVTLTREDFAESPILLQAIQDYSYHQIVPTTEFFDNHWQFLEQPLQPPQTTQQLAKDGAESIAQAVVDYLI